MKLANVRENKSRKALANGDISHKIKKKGWI